VRKTAQSNRWFSYKTKTTEPSSRLLKIQTSGFESGRLKSQCFR
jgi:hypothetical protein